MLIDGAFANHNVGGSAEGAPFRTKIVQHDRGRVKLWFWDLAGPERYRHGTGRDLVGIRRQRGAFAEIDIWTFFSVP